MAKTRSEPLSQVAASRWDRLAECPGRCEAAAESHLGTHSRSSAHFRETLARRVRFHRYLRGWGPSELARRARISRTALFRIERGSTTLPRAVTLQQIAQAFQITIDDLLDESPAPALVPDTGAESAEFPSPGGPEPAGRSPSAEIGGVEQKFFDLIQSPVRDWVIHLIEETHRWFSTVGPSLLEAAERSRPERDDAG